MRCDDFVEHLRDLYRENAVLLPEIQYANNLRPLILWTFHKTLERVLDVLLEARREHVFLTAELMPALPNDRVDHVQARHLVFGLAFVDELLYCVHDMLVELDAFHRAFGDIRHLRLRNRRPTFVEGLELK